MAAEKKAKAPVKKLATKAPAKKAPAKKKPAAKPEPKVEVVVARSFWKKFFNL